MHSAVRREPRPIGPAELERALAELEATRSHFDRRDLLCALANQLPEGADAAALDRAVDDLLGSERVIEIHRGADPIDSTYYTTPRLWELEQRFVRTRSGGAEGRRRVVDEATLAAVLARHSYLSAEQAEMVRRLTSGGERIVAVAALPGSGKTTALAAAREAWVAAGHPVIGVATARSASGELSDAGVPATSITALLIRTGEATEAGSHPLAPGTVIVMDESSTTSTPHAAALAELAERCEGKLVCIGDPRQIGAVGPGGTLRAPDQGDRAIRPHRDPPPADRGRSPYRAARSRGPRIGRARPDALPRAAGDRRHPARGARCARPRLAPSLSSRRGRGDDRAAKPRRRRS